MRDDPLGHENVRLAETICIRHDAHDLIADFKKKFKRMRPVILDLAQLIQHSRIKIDSAQCGPAVLIIGAQPDGVPATLCHLLFKIGNQSSP